MKKSYPLLAFLALTLAVVTVLPSTWAYFTANVRAGGGRTVQMQNDTHLEETYAQWRKNITISATEGTQPLYVRARAFYISDSPLTYSGEGWTLNPADGWYYYDTPLANPTGNAADVPTWAVQQAAPLAVSIPPMSVPAPGTLPEDIPEDFDVTVVYETALVTYNADGTRVPPTQADWNAQKGGAAE